MSPGRSPREKRSSATRPFSQSLGRNPLGEELAERLSKVGVVVDDEDLPVVHRKRVV